MAGLDGNEARLLVMYVVAFELVQSQCDGCIDVLVHITINYQLSTIN